MILSTITLVSTAVGVLGTLSLLRWKKSKYDFSNPVTGVSVVKPIRGVENGQEENLGSFFQLNKTIPYELILSVKDPNDPCLKTIEKLRAQYPDVPCRVLLDTPDIGHNPKINNMHAGWYAAKYDIVFLSDSNIYAAPDYLEFMTAEMQKGVDVVSQVVYGTGAESLPSHLDAVASNTFYCKATAFLGIFGIPVILGKSIMVFRSKFESVGGMYGIRKYLADDFITGKKMYDAGFKLGMSGEMQRQTPFVRTMKAFWTRHVRWVGTRKAHSLAGWCLEPLTFETFWPVLLMIFAQTPQQRLIGAGCLVTQILCNMSIHAFKIRDRGAWSSYKWFWLKDAMYPIMWIQGFFSKSIIWENRVLYLRPDGKLASKYYSRAKKRLRRIRQSGRQSTVDR